MNMKLVGVVLALTSVAVVACGDSGSTSGSGGGGTGGGSTTSTGGAAGTGGSTTNGTGGSGGGLTCEEQYPAGADQAAALVITACGCTAGSDCETECTGSTECDPANGTDMPACGTCIQNAADTMAACAVGAALGPDCTGDCADYVQCVLAG
jgi:hypothetical protein